MALSPTTPRSSLRGLRTFCLAARFLSFRRAAEELHVTPSAVSHTIKKIEQELSQPLFERQTRALTLTTTGEALYAELEPMIARIDEITARYRERAPRTQLRISAQPFFASEFFVPRLEEFTEQHPDIEIDVDTSDESSEVHPKDADVSIRLFRNPPTGFMADQLFPLKLMPACSPGFRQRFESDDDIATTSFPIILHTSRPNAWRDWMNSSGIRLSEPSRIIKLDSMIAVARAAERGIGAALVPMPLSENWIHYGALQPLYEHEVVMDEHYYLVADHGKAESPAVESLRQWVLEGLQDFRPPR